MSDEKQYPAALVELFDLIMNPTASAGVELVKRLEPVFREAERYRWLKSRANEEGRDGGWTGLFSFYPVPAWDDTPYAEQRGRGFNFRGDLDAAVDAAMNRVPAVGAA